MNTALTLVSVIGALAVFMAGFKQINDYLNSLFGPLFKDLLSKDSSLNINYTIRGVIVSALSLSNITGVVLLLSLVNAGLAQLGKTPWVYLGINLGATLSGWVLSLGGYRFALTPIALIILAASFPFKISTYLSKYDYGELLTGVGLLLLGIELLNGSLPIIPQDPLIQYFLRYFSVGGGLQRFLLFFVAGVIIGATIRSNVGVLVLSMSLSYRGWFAFDQAAILLLGSYLGITIIGFIACINMGNDSRKAAIINLFINFVLCIWVSATLQNWLGLADWVMPGESFLAKDVPVKLAFFHSTINLINCFVFAVILKILEGRKKYIKYITADRYADIDGDDLKVKLLPSNLPDSLDSNLIIIKSALAQMADKVYEMLMIVMNSSQESDKISKVSKKITALFEEVKLLNNEITKELTKSVRQPSTIIQAELIAREQRISQELYQAGTSCRKIIEVLHKSNKKNYRFHKDSQDDLYELCAKVLDFLCYNSDFLSGRITKPDLKLAAKMETLIDDVRDRLKKKSRVFLEKSKKADPKGEFAFIQIVGYLEHIGDNCLVIAKMTSKMNRA